MSNLPELPTSINATPVRPVPAASLVLLRRTSGESLEVLLGRRHSAARFMPGVYVVPGGRVEAEDGKDSGFSEQFRPLPPGLDKETHNRAPAMLRAALRETYEETGLLYGAAQPSQGGDSLPAGDFWGHYSRAALRPAFEEISFIARAITPTFSPRRFHTRFLLGDGGFAQGQISGDGELEDIGWYPLEAISGLPMAGITRLVLEEALKHYDHLIKPQSTQLARPAAMFRWVGSKHQGGVSALTRKLKA